MAQGIVVQPGEGRRSSTSPGREFALKLLGSDTGDSIMMFEETVPAGTKSTSHLHHGSDEVAYVLEGEVTFLIGNDVTIGGPGACAFMPRGVPPGRTPAPRPGASCFSIPWPGQAGSLRNSTGCRASSRR